MKIPLIWVKSINKMRKFANDVRLDSALNNFKVSYGKNMKLLFYMEARNYLCLQLSLLQSWGDKELNNLYSAVDLLMHQVML